MVGKICDVQVAARIQNHSNWIPETIGGDSSIVRRAGSEHTTLAIDPRGGSGARGIVQHAMVELICDV